MNLGQSDSIVSMLKVDLQISSTAYDSYLGQLVEAAESYIEDEGITLEATVPDMTLIEMYAAWLYRARSKSEASKMSSDTMPRMLRYALNNRLLREKAASDG